MTSRHAWRADDDGEPRSLVAGERVPIVLVGNKSDLIAKRQVSQDMAMKLAQESMHNCQYLETSAKYNVNVSELFVELLQQAYAMEGRPAQQADRQAGPDSPLLQPGQQQGKPSRKLSHRLSSLGSLPSMRRKSSAASTAGPAPPPPSTPRHQVDAPGAAATGGDGVADHKCHIL